MNRMKRERLALGSAVESPGGSSEGGVVLLGSMGFDSVESVAEVLGGDSSGPLDPGTCEATFSSWVGGFGVFWCFVLRFLDCCWPSAGGSVVVPALSPLTLDCVWVLEFCDSAWPNLRFLASLLLTSAPPPRSFSTGPASDAIVVWATMVECTLTKSCLSINM